ncbi:conserved oligomeric Golgi complex subunit 1 [Nymphaea colorata]|nr:conserved oligomeric Golgi complex subunit 1 [Nymphaea colorata]
MRVPSSRYLDGDAESLFRSRPISEIRSVEASTRKEIDNKQEELRQLVGRSYRDLIQSADFILLMKASSESICANLCRIDTSIRSLSAADGDEANNSAGGAGHVGYKERRKKLYGVGCRIKYLVDTPENIWGFLDESMFLDAAGRYLRARKVHSLLVESPSAKEFLGNFPLLQHQFQLVESFKGQISQRSRDRLLDPVGCSGSTAELFADALSAISIVDELGPDQMLALFLESRRSWVSQAMRNSQAFDGHSSAAFAAVSRSFCEVVTIIQITLGQVGELFLRTSNDLPLFYKKVLSAPPGSQLFGGIPDHEEEAKAWKQHWEKLESVMCMLEPEFISESCLSWVNSVSELVNSAVLSDGRRLVEAFGSGGRLASVEKDVRAKVDEKEALGGSLEWLRSYYGLVIESPWEGICRLVLGQPKNLWDELFEQTFVHRMKEIINLAFEEMVRSVKIKDALKEGVESHSSLKKSSSYGSFWFTDRITSTKKVGLTPMKAMDDENDFHACLDAYFGSQVSRIRDAVDDKCKSILEDLLCFTGVQKPSPRLKELAPFIQERCFNSLSKIVKELEEELGLLSTALNDKHGDKEQLSLIVEKSLLIGRLFFALRNHSSYIPLILGSPTVWTTQGKANNFAKGSSNVWQPRGSLDQPILESPRIQSLSSPRVGFHAYGLDENANPKLQELSKTLRDLCVKAHKLWISWMSNQLAMALAKDLSMDDALSTSTALKGWEETILKQDQSKESSGESLEEMKIALPSMPSLYVTSFLFEACQEIHRVGGHVLDKVILQTFSQTLLEKAVTTYRNFLNTETRTVQVSEKGILQLIFDLRFISDVLSCRSEPFLSSDADIKEKELLKRIPFRSKHSSVPPVSASVNPTQSLIHAFSQRLDPIDWATFESYLWENEKQWYQRNAVLFGFLVQLNRLYTNTVQKLPAKAESNIFRSAVLPRFKYLPISAPVLSSRGPSTPTRSGSSDELSSRSSWKAYSNGEHSPKPEFDDSSSFTTATPLFKSFMTQVGSKFGESTFRLGSMLTDGQVGRLKDKSAAAMSTFGDILPVQAAGLLSSFTAGATRSDS